MKTTRRSDLRFYLYACFQGVRSLHAFEPRSVNSSKAVQGALGAAIVLTLCVTPASAASNIDNLKLYAHSRIINYKQFQCFNSLITKESNWRVDAKNGTHYGLGQMKNKRYKVLDGYTQIDWSIRYITKRYGSMCNGYQFFRKHGYH